MAFLNLKQFLELLLIPHKGELNNKFQLLLDFAKLIDSSADESLDLEIAPKCDSKIVKLCNFCV